MKKSGLIILLIFLFATLTVSLYFSFVVLKREFIIGRFLNHNNWLKSAKEFNNVKEKKQSTLFIGDSMTENLKLYLPESDSIKNMGLGGDFAEGLIMRIDNIANLQPNKIFIMIGINDIIEKVPLVEIEANYCKLIELIKLKSPDSKIYIQSTLPTCGLKGNLTTSRSINKRVKKLNKFLRAFTEKENIVFVDMYDDFCNQKNELKPELTSDGIHLTEKGYKIWLSHIETYL